MSEIPDASPATSQYSTDESVAVQAAIGYIVDDGEGGARFSATGPSTFRLVDDGEGGLMTEPIP